MRRRVAEVCLSIVAAFALNSGCDDSSSTPPPTATYTPTSQPWNTRPAGADEFLASTRQATTTTAPATTQASTRRTRPEALDDPAATVELLFRHLKAGKYAEVPEMLFESVTSGHIKTLFAQSVSGFQRGATVQVIDKKEIGDAALVIVRSTGPQPADNDTSYMLLLRRFDRWKIVLDEPQSRKLASNEKQNLIEVMEWGTERLKQLLGPQTQPAATAPAPKAPAIPAIPPPPHP